MAKTHLFNAQIEWTGNRGTGSSEYRAYDRHYTLSASGKSDLACSADPTFLGDGHKYNPEDLLLSSVSACHMLWYLHLCADAGVVVVSYRDQVSGTLTQVEGGGGSFTEITLNPMVVVQNESMIEKAIALHHKASEKCFIANTLNIPVGHKVNVRSKE